MKTRDIPEAPCKKMTNYQQCNNPSTKAIFVNNGQAGSYRAICDGHLQAIRNRSGKIRGIV